MAARGRVTVLRSYEDYQPSSNLLQEEERETLTVDLPGFRKEQIRVQMDERSGSVMIIGERPIGNGKWSRFRKELPLPSNCITNEIQAKFENEVLRIIMPINTEIVKTPIPPPPSGKPVTESKPTPTLTPQPLPTLQPPPPVQKLVTEPKPIPTPPPPPSRRPITGPEPTPIPQPRISERLNPTPAPQSPSQKMVPEIKPSTIPQSPPSQRPKSAPTPEVLLSEKMLKDTPNPKPTLTKDETSGHTVGKHIDLKTVKPENGENDPHNVVKEKKRIGGLADDEKYKASTSGKQEDVNETKDTQGVKDGIKEHVTHGVEDAKNETRRLAMELKESREYIVNMVAAGLVLVALWVYTKYTITFPW